MPAKKTTAGDQDKPKLVIYKGKDYRLPDTPDDWDLDTLEAFEEGRALAAVHGILGDKSYASIKAQGAKVRDLDSIMDQIAKAYGFETAGESDASTD